MSFDLVIRGGLVVDGTGASARQTDLGIRGDRIAAIGALETEVATRTIDARDRVVAPGFIDLQSHVRDEAVLGLEEAIRKMTSLPAQQLGIRDRGALREGHYADIVIFDPRTVVDRATFDAPHAYPVGIEHVIVNGAVTVEHGEHTGTRAGRAIRARA